MIQDILPHRLDISYTPKPLSAASIVICFDAGRVLVADAAKADVAKADAADGPASGETRFPRCSELRLTDSQATYLFAIDDDDFFLAQPGAVEAPAGFGFVDATLFRTMQPRYLALAGVTAQHLAEWYAVNRICGRCGDVLEHDRIERMMHCPSCQNAVYPKIAPAVIVGVYRGDELLLTRYSGRPHARQALIAGFVEIGETAEDTVHREVMEEAGLKVKNLRYYKSQPWGLSGSLLMGFYAELDGDGEVTLDQQELSEAVWTHRDDIDTTLDGFSLTNEMICRFKQGL